jgi:hypothetical protein
MSKDRSDQVDNQGAEPDKTAPAPADHEERQDDGEPNLSVSEGDSGTPIVEGDGLTRGQRRAQERRKREEEQERRYRSLEDGLAAMRNDFQSTLMAMAQVQRQPAGPTPQTPQGGEEIDTEWARDTERQEEIWQLMQASRDPTHLERLQKEWKALEFKKLRREARKAFEPEVAKLRQELASQEPREYGQLRREFSGVFAAFKRDPRLVRIAQGQFQREAAEAEISNKPFDEVATHRRILTELGERIGVLHAPAPRPSAHQQGRFAGIGGPSNSGGNGSYRRELTAAEVGMAKEWAKGKDLPEGVSAEEAWSKAIAKSNPGYFKA